MTPTTGTNPPTNLLSLLYSRNPLDLLPSLQPLLKLPALLAKHIDFNLKHINTKINLNVNNLSHLSENQLLNIIWITLLGIEAVMVLSVVVHRLVSRANTGRKRSRSGSTQQDWRDHNLKLPFVESEGQGQGARGWGGS